MHGFLARLNAGRNDDPRIRYDIIIILEKGKKLTPSKCRVPFMGTAMIPDMAIIHIYIYICIYIYISISICIYSSSVLDMAKWNLSGVIGVKA